MPWNAGDHTVDGSSDPTATAAALAYAPLYMLLQAKRWLLTPFAVSLLGASATVDLRTNAFVVQAGVMVPIVNGEAAGVTSVSVAVNLGRDLRAPRGATALYPGGASSPLVLQPGPWGPQSYSFSDVPLVRGCVVILLECQ